MREKSWRYTVRPQVSRFHAAKVALLAAFALVACGVRVGNPRQAGTGTGGGNTPSEKRNQVPSDPSPGDGLSHEDEEDAPSGSPARQENVGNPPMPGNPAVGQARGGLPTPTASPGTPLATPFSVELEGGIPQAVLHLELRLLAVSFSNSEGKRETVTLAGPLDLDMVALPGVAQFTVAIPAGRWSEIALHLDAPPCAGVAQDLTPLPCRVGGGESLLSFAISGGTLDPGAGLVTGVRLRVTTSRIAWDLSEASIGFPAEARSAGYKIVLSRAAGSAFAVP
jgi:hypothetical protein